MTNNLSLNDIVARVKIDHGVVMERDKDAKAARGFCNEAKVVVYAGLMADMVTIGTLKSKGLEKGQVMKLKELMLAGGITDAIATRYCANANGVIKNCPEVRDVALRGKLALLDWFSENDIDTETKIRALHVAPVDPLEALAKRIAELSDDDFATVAERVRVLKELAAASGKGGDEELASEDE